MDENHESPAPSTRWQYKFEQGDSAIELTTTVQELGEAGWELVNIVKDKGKVFVAVLKRQQPGER
jgi:hypothetical protein